MAIALRIMVIAHGTPGCLGALEQALVAQGYAPELEVVSSLATLRQVAQRAWDAAIAVYPLEGFPSIALLPTTATAGQFRPFLVIADHPSDEFIIQAVKGGACHVLSRDRMSELGSVLRAELALAELKRDRKRTAEAELRSLRWLLTTLGELVRMLGEQATAPDLDADQYQQVAQQMGAVAALALHLMAHEQLTSTDQELTEFLADVGESVADTPAPTDIIGLEFLPPAQQEIVNALTAVVETRDPYLAGHQRRVSEIAVAIAREMGLPPERQTAVRVAALLHDIGKICIPACVLGKPGELNPDEAALVRMHSRIGADILKSIPFPWPIAKIVLQHHEREDGSGYPFSLRAEDLLPEARIVAVANAFEALRSDRAYRTGLSDDDALAELREHAGDWYYPAAVDACERLHWRPVKAG